MSKELDYLDELLSYKPLTLNQKTIIEYIKEKIQRIEAIDNSKPSEALECLEMFLREMKDIEQCPSNYFESIYWKYKYTFEAIVKQALLQAQKDKAEIEKLKRENCILKAEVDTFKKIAFKGNKE